MKSINLSFFFLILFNIFSYSQVDIVTGGHVGIGTNSPENSENWDKVLNINGQNHCKIIATTSSIQTGIWSHNSGYYGAPAGGIIGTYSNHPFSIITNHACRMTIQSNGYLNISNNVGIGVSANPAYKLDINGFTRFYTGGSNGLLADNTAYYGGPALYPLSNNTGYSGKSDKAFMAVYSYSYPSPSDARQKENVNDINNALDIILKLKGVRYDLKKEYAYNDTIVKDEKIRAKLEK